MRSIRALLVAILSCHLAGCLMYPGISDLYVSVGGELDVNRHTCKIRFVSIRLNVIRNEQSIAPGRFLAGFMYHLSDERLSDFHAELSCDEGAWRVVGPVDAFSKGFPVELGKIAP